MGKSGRIIWNIFKRSDLTDKLIQSKTVQGASFGDHVIIGRYTTNKTTLRKILSAWLKEKK